MLLGLFRYLKGSVKFAFSGGFTQIFLNACLLHGLNLRFLRKKGDIFTAYLPAADYRKIRSLAKKSGIKAHIVQKYGFPFWLHEHRKRYVLVAGILFFLGSLWLFPKFVWEIRISGNQSVPAQSIYGALEEIGVSRGMQLKDLDYDNLRQDLILQLPELSWCSLNIDGSVVTVEVRERVYAPIKNDTPCNLIAKCDGYITQADVYVGTPLVKAGDAVVKGDLLVSGVVEYQNGHTEFKQSKAKILAQTERVITVKQPFRITREVRTGQVKTHRVLELFHLRIPLYLGSVTGSFEQETRVQALRANGHVLPCSIITSDFFETQKTTITLSQQEAISAARKQVSQQLERLAEDAQILQSEESVQLTDHAVCITQKILCLEDLCEQKVILISEE